MPKNIILVRFDEEMKKFYFKNLSYPRNTMDDLKMILFDNGWKIKKLILLLIRIQIQCLK